ncbi:MAG: cyclic pyranopterin monophosphate synthase MoaC [Thermoguttaceae bacterium]|jgi:cyclic pyranopterin phosphate synthase|nr:cyclic pyranopterin monophosphate synthase MoaC [Thermoguttaceae bacterium]
MSEFTHINPSGEIRMVDVGGKEITLRKARASACVRMKASTLQKIQEGAIAKGSVLETARLAGIMAAKQTGALIPLCHPLPLDVVSVRFDFPDPTTVAIEAEVRATARTGVEMEALVAASVAALTVYDMCKSLDRAMVIDRVQLEEKSGGRSGHFVRGHSGTD